MKLHNAVYMCIVIQCKMIVFKHEKTSKDEKIMQSNQVLNKNSAQRHEQSIKRQNLP